jgi:Ser-tRNA(Ala) deacylase AlaX
MCEALDQARQSQDIERRCNEVIRAARPVRQVVVDEGNREHLATHALLRGALPPPGDGARMVVRLIEIEGVDVNACGGTHLHCTAELQVRPPGGRLLLLPGFAGTGMSLL